MNFPILNSCADTLPCFYPNSKLFFVIYSVCTGEFGQIPPTIDYTYLNTFHETCKKIMGQGLLYYEDFTAHNFTSWPTHNNEAPLTTEPVFLSYNLK